MRRMVEKIIAQYGTDMRLASGTETKTVRAFFRAVNAKSWQSMESEATLLGEISRGQYAYIGPVGAQVREGDTLTLGDKTYLFRRAELYYYRNQPVYQWGLCVEKGVNDTWAAGAAAAAGSKVHGGRGLPRSEISADHEACGGGSH
jgi:hypothetical protein